MKEKINIELIPLHKPDLNLTRIVHKDICKITDRKFNKHWYNEKARLTGCTE